MVPCSCLCATEPGLQRASQNEDEARVGLGGGTQSMSYLAFRLFTCVRSHMLYLHLVKPQAKLIFSNMSGLLEMKMYTYCSS